MVPPKFRVILDTNIWLSLLIRGGFPAIFELVEAKQIQILLSIELLDEFLEVAGRPKFQKYFSTTDRDSFLRFLLQKGELVNVNTKPSDCRDSKDNFLLGLAEDGKATHLLTGDHDLLVLNPFRETKILQISDFLKEFE
ncbi:putative toxin-antitoxin system toxin component, PIN family [Algoriphagus sp. A40]|nr:putative toxin-antitoxin system toxin component, PIN family [Algoriphagus sp. A40]